MTVVKSKSGAFKMDGRKLVDILQEKIIKGEDLMIEHNQCDTVIKLEQTINGNGSPGIASLVATHERYIQQQIGSLRTIKITLWFLGISNISTLTAFLIKTFAK